MAISAQRVVIRIGMAEDVPALNIGELGWDVDKKRLRAGDGTPTPPMIMTTKSTDAFEYKFIRYVEYPEIRMLPEGTVDGVDISDLNRVNGFVVRRGDNLWAQRTLQNSDTYITIDNPAGTAGDPVFNLSDEFVDRVFDSLTEVSVDDVTIHGNGRPEAPLYAHTANYTEKGVSRFATGPEVADGILGSVAITPESLLHRTSTFTRTGLIRKATLAEVRAATSTDTVVVPAYLRTATLETVEEWFDANGTSGEIAVQGALIYENPTSAEFSTTLNLTGINMIHFAAVVNGGSGGSQGDGPNQDGSMEIQIGSRTVRISTVSGANSVSAGRGEWVARRSKTNQWYLSLTNYMSIYAGVCGSGDSLHIENDVSMWGSGWIQVRRINIVPSI